MRWYAVYVRSQYERPVAAELERRGIESFLPLLKVTRRWSDREKHTDTPAFPGYVFVRCKLPAARFRVLSVVGVADFIGIQGDAEAIPDDQIEAVRLMLTAHPNVTVSPVLPTRGETVRIIRGPFTGVYGTCERLKKHCRITVSLPLLGQSISTEVPLDYVEVVAPQAQGKAA